MIVGSKLDKRKPLKATKAIPHPSYHEEKGLGAANQITSSNHAYHQTQHNMATKQKKKKRKKKRKNYNNCPQGVMPHPLFAEHTHRVHHCEKKILIIK